MHQAGLRSRFIHYQLYKADHAVPKKRTKVDTAIEKCRCVQSRAIEVHSIIRKALALANGAFVINFNDSSKELVIDRHLAEYDALLFGLPSSVARERPDLMHPPVIEGGDGKDGQVIPLHRVGVFRFRSQSLLQECEDVNPSPALPQATKDKLRVV